MRFRAKVELGGKTATGIPIPEGVVAAIGSGKRPAVQVTLGGHSYRTTVASMGGRYFVPLSKENREAAGVAAGDEVAVDIERDAEPRKVTIPPDLADALAGDDAARGLLDRLSYTHRKEYARWIDEAKRDETRQRRLAQALEMLRQGKTRS